jgi:hypothetical protein
MEHGHLAGGQPRLETIRPREKDHGSFLHFGLTSARATSLCACSFDPMMKKLLFVSALFASITTSSFAIVPVSPITWGAPTNISNDTDVSTAGTLVAAFNMAGPSVTLNGVAFAAFTFTQGSGNTTATNGNFSFSESPGFLLAPNLGSTQAPFTTLSPNYQSLLSSGISTSDNNTLTLTISGLTIGQQYAFQWWLNYSGGTFPGYVTTASATNSVTLNPNTSGAAGGLGQFVIGTFTAASNIQSIAFNATIDNAPTINAFQLRAVPEPTSVALMLASGGISLAAFLRKSRANL